MCSALQLFYCCVCTAMEKLRCKKQFGTVTFFIYLKSLFRASGVLLSALVLLTLVRIKVQISVRIQISLGDSQYHSKATYCQHLKSKNSSYSGLVSVAASLYKLCNSAPTVYSFSSSCLHITALATNWAPGICLFFLRSLYDRCIVQFSVLLILKLWLKQILFDHK